MANTIVEPTFLTTANRLLFLSNLWGFAITAQDVTDWNAHKALYPLAVSIDETENEFSNRRAVWNEERVAVPQWMALSKWDGYKLGKVRPEAQEYLDGQVIIVTPTAVQASEAVRLQLEDKYAVQIVGTNVADDLLSLVIGLNW